MNNIDHRTGRVIGDHGTAMQAIEFALDHLDVERDTFLKCWREGDLDEWPEFYTWLARQPVPEAALAPDMIEALRRQSDNMAFVINHVSLPDQWRSKFMRELDEDRTAIAKAEGRSTE